MNKIRQSVILTVGILFLSGSTVLGFTSIVATNLSANGGNALFDSSGTLLPFGSGQIRLGTFETLNPGDVSSLFATGDLSALNADFIPYDSPWTVGVGTFGDLDGAWSTALTTDISAGNPLIGFPMVTWLTTGASFLDASAEVLIFQSSESFDEAAPNFVGNAKVLDGNGTIFVGEFGNFSHDFGISGGPGVQGGFNTVEVIPEPSTYALMGLGGLALMAGYGRKKRK